MQVIASIEMIHAISNIKMNGRFPEDVEKIENSLSNPVEKFFYNFLYQFISLGNPNIPPLYASTARASFSSSVDRLAKNYQSIPKHIQFLLWITGRSAQDSEVQDALDELSSTSVVSMLSDPRIDPGEKLSLIHAHILPLYEYFLNVDKKNGVKKRKVNKVVEQIKQKIEEIEAQKEIISPSSDIPPPDQDSSKQDEPSIEEILQELFPESEIPEDQGGQSAPGIPGSGWGSGWGWEWSESWSSEGDDSVPDYNPRYDTPEGGSFEKWKQWGFKIEITPAFSGRYVADNKSKFDVNTLKWLNVSRATKYINSSTLQWWKHTLIATYAPNTLKPLPLIKTYALDINSLKLTGWGIAEVFRDQNGAFFIRTSQKTSVEIDFYKESTPPNPQPIPEDMELIPMWGISQDAQKAIDEANQKADFTEKVHTIRAYVRQNHKYPPGDDEWETLNHAKDVQATLQKISNGSTYIRNLDASPYLECYSANTLMIAMLRAVWIPAKLATGFNGKTINKKWNTELNGNNGHAWTLVWDGAKWVPIDATPAQDPSKKKKQDEKKQDDNQDDDKKNQQPSEHADDGWDDSDDGDAQSQDDSEWGDEAGGKKKAWKKAEKEKKKDAWQDDGEDAGDGWDDSNDPSEEVWNEWGQPSPSSSELGHEEDEWLDPDEEFNRMYEELQGSDEWQIEQGTIDDMIESMRQAIEEISEEKSIERSLRTKYPSLSEDEIIEFSKFLKSFRSDLDTISRIKNPDFLEWLSENETLKEELRAILDRVISRRMVQYKKPRYPVAQWQNLRLINPVQLYHDANAWRAESHSYMTIDTKEREKIHIVKVRRRKILDASGSMDEWDKLRMQQQIEVLDNQVTAEKQAELNALSDSLQKDLRLETETWQFGAWDQWFRLLKPMSSTFDELEQSIIWKLSASSSWWTNDYDPLEAIYELLIREYEDDKKNEWEAPTLLKIRTGFLIREINAHAVLEGSPDEQDEANKVHFSNLVNPDWKHVFWVIFRQIPSDSIQSDEAKFLRSMTKPADFTEWAKNFIDRKMLSSEEKEFFKSLDISGKNIAEIYEEWLWAIKEGSPDIEPILEVIEVSSDGWSNHPSRLQEVVSRLRQLWIIVIAYGLWYDGTTVEAVYQNPFNPKEWWTACINLLEYPRKKASTWNSILDQV